MTQLIISVALMYVVVGSGAWWAIKKRHEQKMAATANGGSRS